MKILLVEDDPKIRQELKVLLENNQYDIAMIEVFTKDITEESEKNKEIEKLLEKYDIMPSYYAYGDKDLLQITGDDINRIDDTMTRSLNAAKKLLDLSHIPATYFTLNKEEEYVNLVAEEVSFPESVYQKDGKSYRKNRKMYLKKQGLLS